MLNLSSLNYFGAGGFGDALMVLNKFKTLNFSNDVRLQFFTDSESGWKLIQRLFELNGIPENGQEKPYHYYGGIQKDLDEVITRVQGQRATFTTIWDGDVVNRDPRALSVFHNDVPIQGHLEIHGEPLAEPMTSPYYVLQLEAGFQYHNPRKHWDNIPLLLSMANAMNKKFGLKCVVIGVPHDYQLPSQEFINTADKGFQTIEYIKGARFVIGLSSFVTLCSLMCAVPTIMKKENEHIHQRYYLHPDWQDDLMCIDEIEKNSIGLIFEKVKQYVEEPHHPKFPPRTS